MLILDKGLALTIALLFGLAGLPLSFWLFRNDENLNYVEKAGIGYMLGLVFVPVLFFLESLAGIYFSQPLIFVNWLALFGAGMALLAKDGALKAFMPNLTPSVNWLQPVVLFAIMAAVFLIGASVSGIIIFELDPYFYADGVRQVVYEGRNYQNDMTAWYPTALSSHMGTPQFKYMLASWASLYIGSKAYDPYMFALSISLYPAIIGALSVFFAYLLFSSIYSRRVGLLAAGILAFMPVMLLKFQGGDLQVEPSNVLALIFLFWSIIYALKMKGKEGLVVFAAGYAMMALGSNLGSLVVFAFSAFMFLYSVSLSYRPGKASEEARTFVLWVFAIIALVQLSITLYYGGSIFELAKFWIKESAVPMVAFAVPWLLDIALSLGKVSIGGPSKVALLACLGVAGLLIAPHLPIISDLMQNYLLFGAYTAPLYRTIAEQAPGSAFYNGQFGFIALAFNALPNTGNDLLVTGVSALLGIASIFGLLSTLAVNLLYGVFVWFMNSIIGSNFEYIEKGNSLMTVFLFFGTMLLSLRLLISISRKEEWPLYTLLLLPFIVSVSLVGFGKQKLVMFLAIALIFAVGAFWGEAERFFASHALPRMRKKGDKPSPLHDSGNWKIFSTFVMAMVVLAQFGSPTIFALQLPGSTPGPLFNALSTLDAGFNSQTLLVNSFTPRVYDDPAKAYKRLSEYCASNPGDAQICNNVANWNATLNDPVQLFDNYLCSRSLWPVNTQAPQQMGQVFGYRCSAINGYWLEAMQWIRNDSNVAHGDYVISWWDYGHWINFFGEKNTVLRNEHADEEMIGRTAYAYLDGTNEELRATMKKYNSSTALFDSEILGSMSSQGFMLGGKYDALNYLGCAWANKTDVSRTQRQSKCEVDHLWEQIVVAVDPAQQQRCIISESNGLAGIVAYSYDFPLAGQQQTPLPKYCLTQGSIGGKQSILTYSLSKKDANGDLAMQRASWQVSGSSQDQKSAILTAFYTKEKIWPDENGNLVSGWEDRTTAFYDSNLYSAFFLNQLDGFDLVFNSQNIRIYRIQGAYPAAG